MSQFENVDHLKVEIQKLLGEINKDMSKLKSEVASLHHILETDASLPTNVKSVNARLMVLATEAGINLDNMQMEASDETSQQNEQNASEEESEKENTTQESQRDEPAASTSNVAAVAAATKKLTKKVKRTSR